MANEAYRAVFLRVHPTGKMVLSLTTEPDGNEGQYAELVAAESASQRSTSRSFRRHRDQLRGRSRLQHKPVRRHAGRGC